MKPCKFPEANIELQAPTGMDNCDPMWVHRDGTHCISKWTLNWKERLRVLFTGHVWLWVVSGWTQPPVAVSVEYPFRKEGK
jgi:hypothetical protein